MFTLSLYHDSCPFPFPPDMNRVKGKASEEITIELTEHINQLQPKVDRAATNHHRRTG